IKLVGISSSTSSVVHVSFPSAQTSVLDSLNQQRENGRLCDLSIHVQDRVFKAHRCVLAASSPYFHDQVLLKNMSTVSIPALMDPLAFEGVLSCAYTGQLSMLRDDIVNYLTVGSVLQMWHIVDKCTELLKEGRAAAAGGGGGVRGGGADGGSTNPSSSNDYLKYEGSLMEQTMTQHFQENPGGTRAVSSLLGQVQVQPRAQLLPLDMQGNQILLYSQGAGLSLEAPPPPLGMMGGASFKGPGLDHGSVHLSGSEGGDGVGGASGKVFMCHCGKTFTHKSMRDRHINMHLDLRPFHCPVCAKKFKMKHHLTEHMKTHTGLKPYDCLSCGKKFMWRDSFMRHRSNCERREVIAQTCHVLSKVYFYLWKNVCRANQKKKEWT
uniref:Zinc finger and BTB domain containing 22b n=1 Tax=Gouania willdenowi TaxID=441366 RepID=A0A8C5GK22_GOUWI